jgi:hypothetical protein
MARAQHKLQELSVSLSVALLMISALAGANAAQPREETGFGSNPGNLRMFSYVPANQEPAAPLIVVLHGCKQKASTFASDAGWLALADRSRLALLLPEQKGMPSYFYDVYLFPWFVALWGANNQNACFNWFQPEDTARDRGEALSIRQMIDAMIARHSVDRSRVYVVGDLFLRDQVAVRRERHGNTVLFAVALSLPASLMAAPIRWARRCGADPGSIRRLLNGAAARLMWLEPKAATSRRSRSGMGLPTPAWPHAIGKSLLSSGPQLMAYRRLPGAMSATDQSFASSSSMAMAPCGSRAC